MSTPHTPGPWQYKKTYANGAGAIMGRDGKGLACISAAIMRPENEANARLIAKAPIAPKLADALRTMQTELGGLGNYLHNLQGPLPTGEAKAMAAELVRIFAPARAVLAEWDAQS